MENLAFVIGQAVGVIVIFCIFVLLIKVALRSRSDKYRDGKVDHKIENTAEQSYVKELNNKLDN